MPHESNKTQSYDETVKILTLELVFVSYSESKRSVKVTKSITSPIYIDLNVWKMNRNKLSLSLIMSLIK